MPSLDQIVDTILRKTFLGYGEIMNHIGGTQALYGNTITEEGAAMIVANELGVVLETDPELVRPGRIAETIYAVLMDLASEWDCGGAFPIKEAEKTVEMRGILPNVFNVFIEGEIQRGRIYQPTPDSIALVNFRPSRSTRTEKEGTGMGISDIYSRLLNVEIVEEKKLWDKPLLIIGTGVQEFEQDDTRKVVLLFENVVQKLALNVTNANALAKAWGDDFTKWTGKSLKLVHAKVPYRGKQVDSIGVVAV